MTSPVTMFAQAQLKGVSDAEILMNVVNSGGDIEFFDIDNFVTCFKHIDIETLSFRREQAWQQIDEVLRGFGIEPNPWTITPLAKGHSESNGIIRFDVGLG